MYEHITDDASHADAQALDVATDEQQQQQRVVGKPEEEAADDGEGDEDDDVKMADDKEEVSNCLVCVSLWHSVPLPLCLFLSRFLSLFLCTDHCCFDHLCTIAILIIYDLAIAVLMIADHCFL